MGQKSGEIMVENEWFIKSRLMIIANNGQMVDHVAMIDNIQPS